METISCPSQGDPVTSQLAPPSRLTTSLPSPVPAQPALASGRTKSACTPASSQTTAQEPPPSLERRMPPSWLATKRLPSPGSDAAETGR